MVDFVLRPGVTRGVEIFGVVDVTLPSIVTSLLTVDDDNVAVIGTVVVDGVFKELNPVVDT